jgi:cytochrome c biogenesis protein CcmG/thiol:disulfide interchange protein DsbE
MKRCINWLPALGLALLLGVLGQVLASGVNPSAIASPLTGQPAPALDVPLYSSSTDHLSNADLVGQPALLNFFASWCGPCAAENTLLMEMAKRHDVRIYGIALKDDPDQLKAYLEKRGNPYVRIGFDENGRTAMDWGVSGVPETFVIGADGKVIERHTGELSYDEMNEMLVILSHAK